MTTIVSMGFSRDQALKALRATVWAAPAKDLELMGKSGGGSKVVLTALVSGTKTQCSVVGAGCPCVIVIATVLVSLPDLVVNVILPSSQEQ